MIRFKLTHKFSLLIFSLILMVSLAQMIATIHLTEVGQVSVQNGVGKKLDQLRVESIEQFNHFVTVADEGIQKASALNAIHDITALAKENQNTFVKMVNDSVSKAGETISNTANKQNKIVKDGLDTLLSNATDTMVDIMEFDNRSIQVLANVANFSMHSLNTSNVDSLNRFSIIINELEKDLISRVEKINEELDNIIIQAMEKSEQISIEEFMEWLMVTFEELKEETIKNRIQRLYDRQKTIFDVQSQVVIEETRLFKQKVEMDIQRELENSTAIQNEKIDKIMNSLLEMQLTIQNEIDEHNQLLTTELNELKTELPIKLKTEGQSVAELIDRKGKTSTQNANTARIQVADKVKQSINDTVKKFESSIKESESIIRQSLKESAQTIFYYSLIITISCIIIALILGMLVVRSITKPVKTITQIANAIAGGDLKQQVNINQKDEIGEMAIALNEMVTAQRKLLGNLDRLPTPVFEVNTDLKIVYINDVAAELISMTQEEAIGKSCYNLFCTNHCHSDDCLAKKAIESDGLFTGETIALHEDKKAAKPVRYTSFPTKDQNGHVFGALNFLLDISGEKLINHEIKKIIQAVNDGNLNMRGDSTQFMGTYAELVDNANGIVDAFVKPLKISAEYIELIGQGNIPEKIVEQYKGDFNVLKENINKCIDAINALIRDAKMLVNAAVEGRLDKRADDTAHQGDYAEIIKGVNDTMDAILLPIDESRDVLMNMAQGDLRVQVEGSYKGDHGMMKDAINEVIHAFNKILHQVRRVSNEVDKSSKQLAATGERLSETTQQQASSVNEILSSVQKADDLIKHTAENASITNQLVSEANNAALSGQKEMRHMNESMNEINESSRNISSIIKIIDEIAFQTNILALNAAVEAARAGQHGKGFAVVAQEVRNLAGKSSNAANQTSELIEKSTKTITEGVEIANKTDEALGRIVDNIIKVKDLVEGIAKVSQEQTYAINSVNDGMNQISSATHHIASQSEETATAAKQMANLSEELNELIDKFSLSDTKVNTNL